MERIKELFEEARAEIIGGIVVAFIIGLFGLISNIVLELESTTRDIFYSILGLLTGLFVVTVVPNFFRPSSYKVVLRIVGVVIVLSSLLWFAWGAKQDIDLQIDSAVAATVESLEISQLPEPPILNSAPDPTEETQASETGTVQIETPQTSTPLVLPTPISVIGLIEVTRDEFEFSNDGWELPRYDDFEYRNGQFILRCNYSTYIGCGDRNKNGVFGIDDNNNRGAMARPYAFADNFIVEVEGQILTGLAGAGYGVMFRYEDQNTYCEFIITGDRNYQVSEWQNGNYIVLIDRTFSEAINIKEEINRIHIEGNGDELRFFVNDNYLATLDNTHCLGEEIILRTITSANIIEVAFDNFIVVRHP